MPLESPKTRFNKTIAAKEHSQLVQSNLLINCFDIALLEMQHNQGTGENMQDAVVYHHMLQGARKFRDEFLTLSSKEKPVERKNPDGLPYEQK